MGEGCPAGLSTKTTLAGHRPPAHPPARPPAQPGPPPHPPCLPAHPPNVKARMGPISGETSMDATIMTALLVDRPTAAIHAAMNVNVR